MASEVNVSNGYFPPLVLPRSGLGVKAKCFFSAHSSPSNMRLLQIIARIL